MFTNQLRLFKIAARNISRSVTVSDKNHYASLGISAKATQAEVKAAYYKLSMVYHPDKNKDSEEAGKKFRDVAEAYEVLGNVRLRRLYDRGMNHVTGTSFARPVYPEADDDPTTRFYRSREIRHRPPPPTGKTPIYDFDEWSRSHYGATFTRDMDIKRRERMREYQYEDTQNDMKTERVLLGMGIMLVVFIYFSVDVRSYDNVQYKKKIAINEIPSNLDRKNGINEIPSNLDKKNN